jgi:hypothetical protein
MIRVLLTGDYEHRQFGEAVEWMRRHTRLTVAAGRERALALLAVCPEPAEVIVVAQSRPGQIEPGTFEALRRASPLARIVALLGSWCDGLPRGGQAWPGVIRMAWHRWHLRAPREFSRLAARAASSWHAPATATEAEQFLFAAQLSSPGSEPNRRGLVVISAADHAAYDALADTCVAAGFSCTWLAPHRPVHHSGVSAVLWDAAWFDESNETELTELAARFRPAPVLALVGFPRYDDIPRAREAGASTVIAKPFLVDELYGELDRVLNVCENESPCVITPHSDAA